MSRCILEYKGKQYTLAEVAQMLKVPTAKVYTMRCDGYKSIEQMIEYRRALLAGEIKAGMRTEKVYKTSEGVFTMQQCEDRHPYGVPSPSIRHRGTTWGWDHKCLWLPKMPPTTFREAAIELDGPPRGHNPYRRDAKVQAGSKFDRGKCCYRYNYQERCVHYDERLQIDDGYPEACLNPADNKCINYNGEKLDVEHMTIHTGAPAKHYAPNGTEFHFR